MENGGNPRRRNAANNRRRGDWRSGADGGQSWDKRSDADGAAYRGDYPPYQGERRTPYRGKRRKAYDGSRRGGCLRRLITAALLIGFCVLFFRWSNHSLQLTRWEAAFPDLPDGFDGCRIAVLSDLHGAEFGADGYDLYRLTARQHPDYIFFLGDLEDSVRGPVDGYAERVADALTVIAPTYYITGNHEWAIGGVPELKRRLTAHGVRALSNEFVPLERGGDTLILAGIDDPNGYADQKSPEGVAADLYAAYGNPFWILLAHRNNLFPTRYCNLGAELVLSGHGHGGLIRLPFTDGLISTDRKFFPSWTAGFYEKNGSRLFVTRGLGNSGKTFRLFNRPEVAILTLRKAG